jgi:membrane protein YqaA with SNARE-associated domain
MTEWITNTMTSMGYLGIALLMFLENLFPPIPSELIMPLAGFTVHEGQMQFIPAVVAGIVGTVVGALPWYYLGRVVDEEKIEKLADKYGKWITVSAKDIQKANQWFNRHGSKAVLLCRLVPGVRTLISHGDDSLFSLLHHRHDPLGRFFNGSRLLFREKLPPCGRISGSRLKNSSTCPGYLVYPLDYPQT